jgi:biotin-[acetyl-CoA-carboxylase] ligase BirA-like protein
MFPLVHFETIDSTNQEAKRRLNDETISTVSIIQADSQTAGRGTQGRPWFSPPNAGLYFSIVHPAPGILSLCDLYNNNLFADWSLLTQAAGVACASVLRQHTGISVTLKPINDLYVDRCKLGGILCESVIREEQQGEGFSACRGLITGIGINLLAAPEVSAACNAEQRANIPTSLQACMSPTLFHQWSLDAMKQELSQAITHAVDTEYRTLLKNGADSLLEKYQLLSMAIQPVF